MGVDVSIAARLGALTLNGDLCRVAAGQERGHGDQHDRVERRHGSCLVERHDFGHAARP
jgi:hypothetical protein